MVVVKGLNPKYTYCSTERFHIMGKKRQKFTPAGFKGVPLDKWGEPPADYWHPNMTTYRIFTKQECEDIMDKLITTDNVSALIDEPVKGQDVFDAHLIKKGVKQFSADYPPECWQVVHPTVCEEAFVVEFDDITYLVIMILAPGVKKAEKLRKRLTKEDTFRIKVDDLFMKVKF